MPTTWKRSHKDAGPKKAARRRGALQRLMDSYKEKVANNPKDAARVEAEVKILKLRLGIAS